MANRIKSKKPAASKNERKPIKVTDPNDKRLRAYNDSNDLYNKSEKTLRNIGNSPRNTSVYVRKGVDAREFTNPAYDFVKNKLLDVSGRFDANMNPNNNFPRPKIKQKIMPIGGIGVNEGSSMGGWVNIYKKPVQPYELEKKKPAVKTPIKPAQKPVVKAEAKPAQKTVAKEDKKFYQGRAFMDSTRLRPNYYTKSEVMDAVNKKKNTKKK
jgi:hypothetical protein